MRYLKSKRGILMAGVAITFVFLMSYAIVVFMIDKPEREEENLKLGKMVLDIYDLETKGDMFEFYLKKSMEYSAIKAIDKRLEEGLIDEENCFVEEHYLLYSSADCLIVKEDIVRGSSKYIGEFLEPYLEKYSIKASSNNFDFEGEFKENEIVFEIETNEPIEFSSDVEKISYKLSPEFTIVLNYSFLELDAIETFLKSQVNCMNYASDSSFVGDLGSDQNHEPNKIENCFVESQFSEVEKEKGVVSFVYSFKGILFKEEFSLPLYVDLDGFEKYLDSKDLGKNLN